MGNKSLKTVDTNVEKELPVDKLTAACEPKALGFSDTSEVAELERGMIGQDRAVRAMEFGLKVEEQGYNLFLTGPVGTGKSTYAESKVREIAVKDKTPGDICYVYNFEQPDHPLHLEFAPGEAAEFRQDMQELIQDLKREMKKIFESEDYEARQNEIRRKHESKITSLWYEMENNAREKGFAVQKSPTGIFTVPLDTEGQAMPRDEFLKLPTETQESINKKGQEVQASINESLRRIRNVEKKIKEELKELERETALYAAGFLVNPVKEKYSNYHKVCSYLDQVMEDIIDNLDEFRKDEADEHTQLQLDPQRIQRQAQHFDKYDVNILVSNGKTEGAPVVIENNPTYYNMFGRIDYTSSFGTMMTDFSLIKPGAVHLANGGYLIVNALDLLSNPAVWPALKRTLKTQQARIENLGEQLSAVALATLKPEPFDLNVKVVLIGSPYLYHLLFSLDEDFNKLFKVKVDFDYVMGKDESKLLDYSSFVGSFCSRKKLRHLEAAAMAKVIEYSSRLASHQEKLSTRFHEITEVLVEADYWAKENENEKITRDDILKALEEKIYRSNLIEDKIQESISEGVIIVSIDGEFVGQVNGLSVLQIGDYSFGKPSRITARTSLGRRGIINIDREVKLSGPIHSKGVLVLSGFLSGRYAKDKPLSLNASITFEQTYQGVEGDSASSTELYALLSELSGVPIHQSIAVTGSVNQYGEVQPIGGINEKIEGFYYTCKVKGLTGQQGVLVPRRNMKNLMLRDEVLNAINKGDFHVWAVDTVDEGIEVLTGVEAGSRNEDGTFSEDTINGLVDRQLQKMAESLYDFGRDRGEKETAEEVDSANDEN